MTNRPEKPATDATEPTNEDLMALYLRLSPTQRRQAATSAGEMIGVRAKDGRSYPRGTRLLFWLHRWTGLGVHELYVFLPVRWVVKLLDR